MRDETRRYISSKGVLLIDRKRVRLQIKKVIGKLVGAREASTGKSISR